MGLDGDIGHFPLSWRMVGLSPSRCQGDGNPHGILQGWAASPTPASPWLMLTPMVPVPPSSWAQSKELRKPLERGPKRQLLEVIIFLRLFFLFPC